MHPNPHLVFPALLALTTLLPAQDAVLWPGFRGPEHTGTAVGAPPTQWSDEKGVAWKLALPGPGSSSPVVVGDKIFVTCYTGYGNHLDDGGEPEKLKHHLVCAHRLTGAQLWVRSVPGQRTTAAPRMQITEHGFASPSPATDGRRIFVYFGFAGIVAFDLDGEQLWQASTGTLDAESPKPSNQILRGGKPLSLRWGAASSPVLHDGMVIVNASEESNSIRAYDQETGRLIWAKTSPDLEGCASSPLVVGEKGAERIIVSLGGQVWALHPKTGKAEWSVQTGTRGGMSPTPLSDGEHVYAFGGLGTSYALRLGAMPAAAGKDGAKKAAGDAAQKKAEHAAAALKEAAESAKSLGMALPEVPDSPRIAWRGANLDTPSAALHQGKLFLVRSDGSGACLEAATGKQIFKGRLEGRTSSVYASPIVANGHVYVVSRKRGTFVYTADGKFKLVARNELTDDAQFNATPAVVGDRLYLRSDKNLYCIR